MRERPMLADYFCVCTNRVNVGDSDLHVVSHFNVAYENHEVSYSTYAFPVWAYLANVHFIFFAYDDWAVSSAFVLGVSGASFLRTN